MKQCYGAQCHSRAQQEEIAALIAVVAALASAQCVEPAPHNVWADPGHRLRSPLHPGPDGWHSSALPRRAR
ncbi:MAG: acyl-CoA carboxylase subunit epsilon [Pseudonocardiaceae bacterium]